MARGFYLKPISAGFCTIDISYKTTKDYKNDKNAEERSITHIVNVHCFGESISLGLKSRKEDSDIINKNI